MKLNVLNQHSTLMKFHGIIICTPLRSLGYLDPGCTCVVLGKFSWNKQFISLSRGLSTFCQQPFFLFICCQQLFRKQNNNVVHRTKFFLGSNLELKLLTKCFSSQFWIHLQDPFFLMISSQFTRREMKLAKKQLF